MKCLFWDVLTKPDIDKEQGSRSPKVCLYSVEEQQFIHLVGQKADIGPMNWLEHSLKPCFSLTSTPDRYVSCLSNKELSLLQLEARLNRPVQ